MVTSAPFKSAWDMAAALERQKLIAPEVKEHVEKAIGERAAEAALSGKVKFSLSDEPVVSLSPLRNEEIRRILFDNSLLRLGASSSDTIKAIVRVEEAGPDSHEYRALRARLNDVAFDDSTFERLTKLFPAETEVIRDRREIVVYVDSDDRLLKEDVQSAVREIPGVTLAAEKWGAELLLYIKRLAWNERQPQANSQTVQYAQHQVDILAAALLMPRNATYMYELNKGSAELEYAFELRAVDDKGALIADELVRDTVRRSWSSCSGARVMNVFGGMQPADFMANDHMKAQCSTNSSPVSAADLRRDAFAAVARRIRLLGPIAEAIKARG